MPGRKPHVKQAAIVHAFAARLRELRRLRGMSQAELAELARVTPSYVWKLESGKSAPGLDLMERLAQALGVSLAELLPDVTPPDTTAVLKERAQQMTSSLLANADRETLLTLNSLLARLLEATNRHR